MFGPARYRYVTPMPASFSDRTASLYLADGGLIPSCRHQFGRLVHQLRRRALTAEDEGQHLGRLPYLDGYLGTYLGTWEYGGLRQRAAGPLKPSRHGAAPWSASINLRQSPSFAISLHRLTGRSPPSQGGNAGSAPAGGTICGSSPAAEAPGLNPGQGEFESRDPHQFARVAQLAGGTSLRN